MAYFARERIFRGCGPNLSSWTAVFAVDDLTEDECHTLAASVQHCLDEWHEDGGHGPWHIELGPSASENAAVFVNLKSEWDRRRAEVDGYADSSSNSWQVEVHMLYSTALEHADIIRGMREGHFPTVYLQCDGGRGYESFDCVDSLTWDEIEILEAVLGAELNEMGLILRIISDWEAEREPATYVQAKLSWKRYEEDIKNDEADDTRMAALGSAFECIEEIKGIRKKPVVFGTADENEQVEPAKNDSNGDKSKDIPLQVESLNADEGLRSKYRDSDNYWRNVWIYGQRKEGKTNAAILEELASRAAEFAPLESENAIRNAIDSIAEYHGWPVLKGKTGRPRAT